MSYETRPQTYDETIRILEKKDYRGIAEFILPVVKEADGISIEHTKLAIPDMREMDFLVKINMDKEIFILHIEFETAYKSNVEMMKRMLRYYTYIKWHNDLPIYQVLMILKKPEKIKNIKGNFESVVQDLEVMKYNYKIIKAYEIDKNDVLEQKNMVLYPLRVFMKHDRETEKEHILECLSVVEKIEDTDYYFLTVECLKKLYQTSEYENFVKEEIYMSSALYKEPYEKGREEGLELGEVRALARTLTKLLVKKFGILTDDLKEGIQKLDTTTLEIMIDNIDGYNNLEDIKKYIQL